MAEKKLKIIREFVNSQFREIKKEKQEEEEEEEIPEELDEFSGFSSGDFAAPVLKSGQTLEQEISDAPSGKKQDNSEPAKYDANIYNMPDYSGNREAQPIKREMERRRIFLMPEERGREMPRAEIETWHELNQQGGRIKEDKIIEAEQLDIKRKEPWEAADNRKYKRKIAA